MGFAFFWVSVGFSFCFFLVWWFGGVFLFDGFLDGFFIAFAGCLLIVGESEEKVFKVDYYRCFPHLAPKQTIYLVLTHAKSQKRNQRSASYPPPTHRESLCLSSRSPRFARSQSPGPARAPPPSSQPLGFSVSGRGQMSDCSFTFFLKERRRLENSIGMISEYFWCLEGFSFLFLNMSIGLTNK